MGQGGNAIMRDAMLVFGSPMIDEAEIAEVVATLRSGWIGTGPRVAQFEARFREYVGAQHAVALNSCTTANAILHTGARPVFVDVDRATGNIDPDLVEAAVTPNTRAILPVHYAGRPCRMDRLEAIARRHGLFMIEDAAHA